MELASGINCLQMIICQAELNLPEARVLIMSSQMTKLLKGYAFPAEFRGRLGSSSSGGGGTGEEIGSTPTVKLK